MCENSWYDQKIGEALAREALEKSNDGLIAFLSTPAAFKALKELEPERKYVYLFNYDHRFGDQYGDIFVFYDYNNPLDLDSKLHHFLDYVLVEPPYLTSQFEEIECKQILKTPNTFINSGAMHKVMYNERQLVPRGFVPTFESKLSNRLTTYINYKSERFGPCAHEFDDDVEE
ncbi:N(6)-adenine-specific DNA methyltransferase 2 [Thraustotheca clavata]|uniref:N(6)-adenine-specific DNA methyltransferase 2 n=1 Tax=Thraustotheca clavata TaxID=74557 RepID=A0A1V9ZQZ0_9STRA|nr:N(6)-adenine-specific DNA methyltransferase 2 [Thraustotheca clavata]